MLTKFEDIYQHILRVDNDDKLNESILWWLSSISVEKYVPKTFMLLFNYLKKKINFQNQPSVIDNTVGF